VHELGVDLDDRRAFAAAPVQALLEAQQRVEADAKSFLDAAQSPFYPSVTADILPDLPVDAMARGAAGDVDVLIGTNADETALWGMQAVADDRLERVIGRYVDDPAGLIDTYRGVMPDATAGRIALAISTDHTFRIPAVRLAEARVEAPSRTFMYEFDWKSRAFGGALGACHALEIPFVFDTLDAPGVEMFLGTRDLPVGLSGHMHDAWTSFIRHGDPMIDGWEPYEPDSRIVYRFAESGSAAVADPGGAVRLAWDGLR